MRSEEISTDFSSSEIPFGKLDAIPLSLQYGKKPFKKVVGNHPLQKGRIHQGSIGSIHDPGEPTLGEQFHGPRTQLWGKKGKQRTFPAKILQTQGERLLRLTFFLYDCSAWIEGRQRLPPICQNKC